MKFLARTNDTDPNKRPNLKELQEISEEHIIVSDTYKLITDLEPRNDNDVIIDSQKNTSRQNSSLNFLLNQSKSRI